MSDDIDDLLESGDLEAIDKLVDDNYGDDVIGTKVAEKPEEEPAETPAESAEPAKVPEKEPEPETPAKEPPKEAAQAPKEDVKDGEPSSAEPEYNAHNAVVMSKDGKHQLPYNVLEQAREAEKDAKAQLKEAQTELEKNRSQLSEGQNYQRLSETLKAQLERHNLKPDELPENVKLTPEQIKELQELGAVGETVLNMVRKTEYLQDQLNKAKSATQEAETASESSSEEGDPAVNAAVEANPELKGWAGTDRWETALSVEQVVRKDPAFAEKPLAEAYAEVVRRVKAIYGDTTEQPKDPPKDDKPAVDLEAAAAAKLAEAKEKQIPQSLTDVGTKPTVEKSMAERLSEKSDAELTEEMEKMSPEELDQLYKQIG